MSAQHDTVALYEVISELLHKLGWRNSCDAQSTNLRDALPELKQLLTHPVTDGGSAFPVYDHTAVHRIGAAALQGITDSAERDRIYIEVTAKAMAGMTLRDYAAIYARVEDMGINAAESLAGRTCPSWNDDPIGNMTFWAEAEAAVRYLKADAMLKARAK